jgi:CRP-like cAMP-binding protein
MTATDSTEAVYGAIPPQRAPDLNSTDFLNPTPRTTSWPRPNGKIPVIQDTRPARRSASVVAVTDLKVGAIPAWGFEPFLAAHPQVTYRMLQSMSKRLREAQTA